MKRILLCLFLVEEPLLDGVFKEFFNVKNGKKKADFNPLVHHFYSFGLQLGLDN